MLFDVRFKKKFSFPINLDEILIKKTIDIEWFIKYQELIEEVYIPAIMLNHTYDAHWGSTDPEDLCKDGILLLEDISKQTDIKIALIFNDTFLSEKEELILIDELSEYLKITNLNIGSIICPSERFLILKKDYPNILFKNTVILDPSMQDIKDGKFDNFDMIYVHDELVHNLEKYKKIKGNRKFGCIVNFIHCRTDCPFKNNHYYDFKQYDGDHSQQVIDTYCPTFKASKMENLLKGNSIPSYYSSYLKFVDVLDIFKLQGRRSNHAFKECRSIIENIYNKNEVLVQTDRDYKLTPLQIIKWKNEVINCSGQCAACSFCDDIIK